MKEQLYFDMSVKFDTFPKIHLEDIEILSSAEILSNYVNCRRYELHREVLLQVHKFYDYVNK